MPAADYKFQFIHKLTFFRAFNILKEIKLMTQNTPKILPRQIMPQLMDAMLEIYFLLSRSRRRSVWSGSDIC